MVPAWLENDNSGTEADDERDTADMACRRVNKSAQWSRYSKKPFLRHRDAGWDVRHLK